MAIIFHSSGFITTTVNKKHEILQHILALTNQQLKIQCLSFKKHSLSNKSLFTAASLNEQCT